MNKKNKQKILTALTQADPPLTTRDFNLLIPEMHERTLRRGLLLMHELGAIIQVKGGRGYSKGVTYTIESINDQKVSELQKQHGLLEPEEKKG